MPEFIKNIFNNEAFFDGVSRVVKIGGTRLYSPNTSKRAQISDWDMLGKDWKMVGKDIKTAMDKHEKETFHSK